MPVYKKDNGKWYCRGRVEGERYHMLCSGAKDKEEAKIIENAERYKIAQKHRGLIKDNQSFTFGQIMDNYVESCRINNKSDYNAKIMSKYLCKYFGKNKNIMTIRKADIEGFKMYMLKKGRTKATINRYLAAIKRAYNLLIQDDLINYNPVKKGCMLEENNKRSRYLTKSEWNKLKLALPESIYYIVVVALLSGFRLSNVLNLKWEQIDFALKFIEIPEYANKGGKFIRQPMSEALQEVLLSLNPKEKGYLFINPKTNLPYTTIKKSFKSALEKANIHDFTFHDLRRTFGTWLLQAGVDIRTIQVLLSHSDISTTERYLAITTENNKLAINKLSKYI